MALSIDQMDLTNSGFDVGIVMQRDTVRRPVGDVGNAKSYPFPVLYQQVHDATVLDLFDPGIALAAPEPWVEAARDLERAGVKGISGGCGFMAIHQPAMAAAVDVPVFTSALLWVPLVERLLGRNQRIGIMTANNQVLGEEYYQASGWSSEDIPVFATGLEDTDFGPILPGTGGPPPGAGRPETGRGNYCRPGRRVRGVTSGNRRHSAGVHELPAVRRRHQGGHRQAGIPYRQPDQVDSSDSLTKAQPSPVPLRKLPVTPLPGTPVQSHC